MPRIKKGNRVIFVRSNNPTVIYTVENISRDYHFEIRSHPDFQGSWCGVSRKDLVLVTPELEQWMGFLNKQLARKKLDERIEILKKVFNLLEIF